MQKAVPQKFKTPPKKTNMKRLSVDVQEREFYWLKQFCIAKRITMHTLIHQIYVILRTKHYKSKSLVFEGCEDDFLIRKGEISPLEQSVIDELQSLEMFPEQEIRVPL